MSLYPFIAIEGPIGVGKTSLARLLGIRLPAEVVLEVFEENPFLSDFYADRARYAFQTQLFFLLSRYHQQRSLSNMRQHSGVISDYLFAKDWLFAHLNLAGDELAMYERVYEILSQQIPVPTLVIYLRASLDTLMQRIAFRDRPYERQMDRAYIASLQAAYEAFFAGYAESPVLIVDTDDLDYVRESDAQAEVVRRVRNALSGIDRQLPLFPGDRLRAEGTA